MSLKFKIVKSELVDKQETHVYTLEHQQVSITQLNGVPVRAIVRSGSVDENNNFIADLKQEGLSIDLSSNQIKAVIKVLKEVYGEI